jgi:hypothetical protein
MELVESYLKGYASTWWRTVRQEEGKSHGYTWEYFKEHIELEFIPKTFYYISRCKFCDFVNATNDNLRQYVRAYSELGNHNKIIFHKKINLFFFKYHDIHAINMLFIDVTSVLIDNLE